MGKARRESGGVVTPFEFEIWDAAACAEYLRQEKSTFLKKTQYAPGFPPRLEIPGQPRWRAAAVAKWALGAEIPPNSVKSEVRTA